MEKHIIITYTFIFSLFLSSCGGNSSEVIDSSTPEYVFSEPILDWGCTYDDIVKKMNVKDEYFFFYSPSLDPALSSFAAFEERGDGDNEIIYGFKNKVLATTLMYLDASRYQKSDILKCVKGYSRKSDFGEEFYINNATATVCQISTITRKNKSYYMVGWSKSDLDIATAVDLGLSVKWSDVNINIYRFDEAGLFYGDAGSQCGWGDPTGLKTSTAVTDYVSTNNISGTNYDIARVKWGGNWRIPTLNEVNELINKCNWQWEEEQYNGYTVRGYRITGPNGNSIFLPTTSCRRGTQLYGGITDGYYWSGTLSSNNSIYPCALTFNESSKGINTIRKPDKTYGCAIRPVTSK